MTNVYAPPGGFSPSRNQSILTTEAIVGFFDMCKSHDWYYMYSDDHVAFKRGESKHNQLRSLSALNPEFHPIFEDWHAYSYSGPLFGTEQLPLPKVEDYV